MKRKTHFSTPNTTETLTLRQQQALERREQIVETALRLFAQQGFDGTSTKQIAQAAGIAEGLIFHYFPTKADLLTAVLETRHSFIGELRTMLSRAPAQPVDEVLQTLATAWLATLRREREITLVLFSTAQINRKVGEALNTLIAEGITRLSTYLRLCMTRGELRADLPVESSAQIFFSSLMIFFVVNHHLPETEWQAQSATFVVEMLAVWFAGTRP